MSQAVGALQRRTDAVLNVLRPSGFVSAELADPELQEGLNGGAGMLYGYQNGAGSFDFQGVECHGLAAAGGNEKHSDLATL